MPSPDPEPPSSQPEFRSLGLPVALAQSLQRAGLREAFPIQASVIPSAVEGKDVLASAPTGSGKTLAFGLPMLARLSSGDLPRATRPGNPRGVVLCPTRELAEQVFENLDPHAAALGLRALVLVGGVKVRANLTSLARTVDIVVATPGRLNDLIKRRAISLEHCAVTVVDEADHMADLGFLPQVQAILERTPQGGQRLLFSATLDGEVAALAEGWTRNPVRIDAAGARSASPVAPDHAATDAGGAHDRDAAGARATAARPTPRPTKGADAPVEFLLSEVADNGQRQAAVRAIARKVPRVIFFVRTTHAVTRWAKYLSAGGVKVSALHGNRGHQSRQRALADFREGKVRVLVATDIAARGIDVPGVRAVVHIDPPRDPKALVHRSGRTGRAGASGTVALLAFPDQVRELSTMMRSANLGYQKIEPTRLVRRILRE
ncbi:DEAD/DEAH box helicase [Corynebacterium sp. UMB4614]|uniref:DEAD/DEAH box helicase n=1 Tax=Corynebacterium sp. UMB4614 TaxID=3046334 RepID=UPI0025503AA4|nr:DEAD/DEAH box helicase [Corynebacterium sp. UMB4614]MDK7135415.1 DEAD/DEAH box helicase [Corynebacterium sp. UMB4614]